MKRRLSLQSAIAALALAFVTSFFVRSALAQQPFKGNQLGIVSLPSQSPLQQLRFGLIHHDPWIEESGSFSIYFQHTWKNIWLCDPDYFVVDGEVHEFAFRGVYGLGHGLEIAADVPVRYISGGIMDRVIEGFHNFMSIGNARRDEYPRNSVSFALNPHGRDGEWQIPDRDPKGWVLGNTVVSLTAAIPQGDNQRIRASASLNVKIPNGSQTEFFGGQSVDFGMSGTVSWQTGRFALYASPGVVYYSNRMVLGVELHRYHFSGLAAIEYHSPGSPHAFILQTLMESSIAVDYRSFSDNTYELLFGYKRRLSEKTLMEVGFLENLFFFDNSPDFGLHLTLKRCFD